MQQNNTANNSKRDYSKIIPVSSILKRALLFIPAVILFITVSGCSMVNMDIFGFTPGEEDNNEAVQNPVDMVEGGIEVEESGDEAQEDPSALVEEPVSGLDDSITGSGIEDEDIYYEDIDELRSYYSEAIDAFQDEAYLLAEYSLNRIKDRYIILQDHVFYYLAKSLLLQEKYDLSGEYYLKIIQDFPDSIWIEQARLEYGDLFFLKEDYVNAEEEYMLFIETFPGSPYIPYGYFQLATCQEKNGNIEPAFESYKKIWFEFPAHEYADTAYENMERLTLENSIPAFIPTAEEIFSRGEEFFKNYHYNNVISELNKILTGDYSESLSTEFHCKILFKLGMSYYNLHDYGQSRDYLSSCYEKSSSSSVADDSLYYMGRALTNLDRPDDAISYYQKLLSNFPGSNFADDALYRTGRIYSIRGDAQNAINSFQKIFDSYPNGDKLADALWELGWIQYKSGSYSNAKTTFSNMAASFKGGTLGEKGLFWQAKCHQKLGEDDRAKELYRDIVDLKSYSYYTFAARGLLSNFGEIVQIPAINQDLNPESLFVEEIIPDVFSNLHDGNLKIDGQMDHIARALELMKMEFYNSASAEIEAGSSQLEENPARILEVATLFFQSQDYASSIRILYKNSSKLKNAEQAYIDYSYFMSYPYGYREYIDRYSSQHGLDPLFTLAVIRQESSFQPKVGSYAGAQGLMQIMPATGRSIAGQIGIQGYSESMLHDPDVSIKMGTFYLRQQLDSFDQSMVYCLGAYNGGPGAMSRWISNWGDKDPEEFIEYITYLQTREYIKLVLRNYWFYQILYD